MILQSNYKPLETISPDDEVSDGTSWIVALTPVTRIDQKDSYFYTKQFVILHL